MLEQNAIAGQSVDIGSFDFLVTVALEMVGSKRINRYDEDSDGRDRLPAAPALLAEAEA